MKSCLKLIQILFVGFSIFYSIEGRAQFRGCHYWCGNESNKAWQNVIDNGGSTADADSAKNTKFNDCIATTKRQFTSEAQCNGETSNDNVPTPTSNPNRCVSEYNDLVQQCDASLSSAQSACDEKTSSAFSSSPSSDSSTDGVTDSCKAANSTSNTAKNAWTSFKSSCESGMDGCYDKCGAIATWANNNPTCLPAVGKTRDQINKDVYSPKISSCMDLKSHVDTADKNIKTYSDNASTSQACNDSTSGGSGGGQKDKILGMNANDLTSLASMAMGMAGKSKSAGAQALVSFCQANPAYPGCSTSSAVDCSNPSMASTNKVCICAANPRDSQCATYTTASEATGTASIDSSSRLPAQNQTMDPDMPNVPSLPLGGPAKSGDAADVGGRQGAGAPVGGGQAGLGGGQSGGKGANTTVGSDATGGGGGGGFFGSGGGGAGGKGAAGGVGAPIGTMPRYGSTGGSGNGANGTGASGQPDLRQFLPGGVQDPRARMMMGGGGTVGQDGITGPHTNNFSKMQNRYRILQGTLYP